MATSGRDGKGFLGILLVLVLVAGLVGAAVATTFLHAKAPEELNPEVPADVVPVVMEPVDDGRDVELIATVPQPAVIPSPAEGIVTAWTCAPGKMVNSGESVATIGNLPVVGLNTTTPMWRGLKVGVRGADVAELSSELLRLGLVDTEVEKADATLIKALAVLAGLSEKTEVIPVGTFFWLSAPSVAWAGCDIGVSSRVSVGQQLGTLVSQPSALTLKSVPTSAVEGERTLTMDGVQAAMTGLSITDPASLAALASTEIFNLWRSTNGVVPLKGRWTLTTPIEVAAVPASAVISDASGTCVRDETSAYPVTVVASSLGRTQVRFPDTAPTSVLAVAPTGATCR